MNEDISVEEIALMKGEECVFTFMEYCGALNAKFKEEHPPETIIEMALTLLAFWHTKQDDLSREDLYKYKILLQKVITYTVINRDNLTILN